MLKSESIPDECSSEVRIEIRLYEGVCLSADAMATAFAFIVLASSATASAEKGLKVNFGVQKALAVGAVVEISLDLGRDLSRNLIELCHCLESKNGSNDSARLIDDCKFLKVLRDTNSSGKRLAHWQALAEPVVLADAGLRRELNAGVIENKVLACGECDDERCKESKKQARKFLDDTLNGK